LDPVLEYDEGVLKETVSEVLNDLCAVGDILELTPADAHIQHSRQQLWSAPPCYIETLSEKTYLLGSKGDAITFIPDELKPKIKYAKGVRYISSSTEADISTLTDYGLFAMTSDEWVGRPKVSNPNNFLSLPLSKLRHQPEAIDDLILLSGSGGYYRDRWEPLSRDSDGVHIAKRPQRFGGDQWSLVKSSMGSVTQLYDIFGTHSRERACDRAWMLQHALAAVKKNPEKFRLSKHGENFVLSLFFPIPNWAEKYILLVAEKIEPKNALISFQFSESVRANVLELLEDGLWMQKMEV
jgi:hypothetical protein